MTAGWLSNIATGRGEVGIANRSFQFDRPAEHGLAPRSYGGGAWAGAEAGEAAVDGIRDAVLTHYDPTEAAVRWPEVDQLS